MTDHQIYKAFGLIVDSEIFLPELVKAHRETVIPHVVIKKSDLQQVWLEQGEENKYFVINHTSILFHMPEVAIFLIRNGNEILISPMEGAHEDHIRLYTLGTCMGAILMQRRILPLHGSAIVIDGEAYAIVGESGAGKSTLASAFLKRGYQLLSDDVIPVTINQEGQPVVTPAYPQQKLWMESLHEFGMTADSYRPIIDREMKFAIPVKDKFASDDVPLAGVIELSKTDDAHITMRPVQNLERFPLLFAHTYRNFFIAPAGLMDWHFKTTAQMVNKMKLFQLQRPMSRFTAHELTELILSAVRKEEKVL
ncbi:aldolase [Halalkalibacter akibai]|uniref:Serine kinase n=1 Tax=Halalkalibacter akibai (strain ATCC 43226 / DSM 21942 / CIP 109018 / JCM 9157 / 1139) TaxID=1236973 RepID=W4QV36_HALA3|nr:aldolase [Halalkalibacter akibai]GAE35941.1 serine kinase [Halalkalibacter akibai JCM 9157]